MSQQKKTDKTLWLVMGLGIGVLVLFLGALAYSQYDKAQKIEQYNYVVQKTNERCDRLQEYYNSYSEMQGYNLKCDKLVDAILG